MTGQRGFSTESGIDRRTFLKLMGAGGLGLWAAGALTACAPSNGGGKLLDLPVISFSPPVGGSHLPVVIKAKGFDKEHGVNLINEFRNTTDAYYNDFASGNVPIHQFGASNVWANMYAKGVKLKIIFSSAVAGQPIFTMSNRNDINTFKDLKGKRVAVDKGSFTWAWFLALAKLNSMDLEKDVNLVAASIGTSVPLLLRGDVDAAYTVYDVGVAAKQKEQGKIKKAFDLDAELAKLLGVGEIESFAAVQQSFDQANPGAIQKMFTLWRDSADWFNKNLDEAIKIIAKPTDQGGAGSPEPVVREIYTQKNTVWEVRSAEQLRESLVKQFQTWKDVGWIDKVPDDGIIYTGLK